MWSRRGGEGRDLRNSIARGIGWLPCPREGWVGRKWREGNRPPPSSFPFGLQKGLFSSSLIFINYCNYGTVLVLEGKNITLLDGYLIANMHVGWIF